MLLSLHRVEASQPEAPVSQPAPLSTIGGATPAPRQFKVLQSRGAPGQRALPLTSLAATHSLRTP
ncbi:MAG TPA: hypothetical protein VFV25_08225 [Methylibium sp.]